MKNKVLSILNVIRWVIFSVLILFSVSFLLGKLDESIEEISETAQKRYTYIDDTIEFIGMKDVQEEEPQTSSGIAFVGGKIVPGAVTTNSTKTVNYIYFKYGNSEIEVKDNVALSIKCQDLSKGDTLDCVVEVDESEGTSKVVSIDGTEL